MIIIIIIIPWLFGCCFASSFFGRCCVVPYPSLWCCLPSPPSLSEAAFSPSSVWWCFISSPSSLGGAAFSPSSAGRCCLTFSFFGWCFGWGYFFLLFCWVVPLGFPLWVVLRLALSPFAWCCLPSPPFWWCCFLSPLLLGGVAWPPSLGGVALFPLFFCVVLPSFTTFFGRVSFKKKNQKKNRKKRS